MLTKTQMAMLRRLEQASERTPMTGGRGAGAVASGWYRTADALERLGLVVTEREGDARRAHLTVAGVMFLRGRGTDEVAALKGAR